MPPAQLVADLQCVQQMIGICGVVAGRTGGDQNVFLAVHFHQAGQTQPRLTGVACLAAQQLAALPGQIVQQGGPRAEKPVQSGHGGGRGSGRSRCTGFGAGKRFEPCQCRKEQQGQQPQSQRAAAAAAPAPCPAAGSRGNTACRRRLAYRAAGAHGARSGHNKHRPFFAG